MCCLRVVLALLVVTGCATTSGIHVERGDQALRAGRLYDAEAAYKKAAEDGEEDPWVRAKVAQGLASVEVAKTRRDRPHEKMSGAPAKIFEQLLAERQRVQNLGGDPEVDARLVAALGSVGTLIIDAAQARPAIEVLAASLDVQPLLVVADLPADVRAKAEAIEKRARDRMLAGAQTAGGAAPLSSRIFRRVAVDHGGPAIENAQQLSAPYERGLGIAITGVACGDLSRTFNDLAARGTQRRAELSIEIKECIDASTTSRTTEMVNWTERVVVRVDRKVFNRQVCATVTRPVYACSGTPVTCAYAGQSPGRLSCRTESEVVETPVYGDVPRTGTRPVTQQRGSYTINGAWVLRRDGREWRGAIGSLHQLSGKSAPRIGEAPAVDTTLSFASFQGATAADAKARISVALEETFAADVAAASAEAQALEAAGRVAEADEAWVRTALLGGQLGGTWQRLGITATHARTAFHPSAPSRTVWRLPDAYVFQIPQRTDRTERDLRNFDQAIVPVGKFIWFNGGGSYQQVPAVMVPGIEPTLAGSTAITLGIQFGATVIGWKRKSNAGLGLFDDASAALGTGFIYESPDEAIGYTLTHVSAAYAFGLRYRKLGLGGIVIGARPELGYLSFASSSATYAGVPAFARLEMILGLTAISIEGYTPITGDERTGVVLYLSRMRKERAGEKIRLTRFLTISVDRRSIDATLDIPGDIENEHTADDLELTSVSINYGVGF